METQILCSTGTLVGRANGYDYHVIIENRNAVAADGFELMMLKAWYDKLPEVADALERAGVKTPTIHFEKDVGALLSLGSEEDKEEGLRLFTLNADMAKAVGAEKAVFHLWDGRFSEAQLAGAKSAISAACASRWKTCRAASRRRLKTFFRFHGHFRRPALRSIRAMRLIWISAVLSLKARSGNPASAICMSAIIPVKPYRVCGA